MQIHANIKFTLVQNVNENFVIMLAYVINKSVKNNNKMQKVYA